MTGGLRVMIVDEDPDSRVAVRKSVVRGGLEVAAEMGYGTQAVSSALEAVPDVVLVAVEEPAARPLETAEALANALPDTPILVYSSAAEPEAIRRSMVFGARDYLVKPLAAASLKASIVRALEQEERRQMRRAGQLAGEHGRGSVIVVTGAKGGIGKTVVSVNLAIALHRETGKSVALIDADTQFGDVAHLMDLAPAMTASELVRDLDSVTRVTLGRYVTVHDSGVEVLATRGDEEPWEGLAPERWDRLIELFATTYEFVVVDTSGALDAFVRGCVQGSTVTLLVTTSEVSSVRDAGAALRRLRNWGIPEDRIKVVFNQGIRAGGVRRQDIETALDRPVFWELPSDPAVPRSVQYGQPVVANGRRSAIGESISALARLLAGTRTSLVEQPARERSVLGLLTRWKGESI